MKRAHLASSVGLVCAAGIVACAAAGDESSDRDGGPDLLHEGPDGSSTGSSADASTAEDGCADDAACNEPMDCSAVDFCAVPFPLAKTIALNAVWGSSATDVWAVGTRGTVLHGDGTTFTTVPVDTPQIFFAVWGSGHDDVWVLSGKGPMRSTGFTNGGASFVPVLGSTWNIEQSDTGHLWAGYSADKEKVWLAGEPTTRFTETWGEPSSFFRLAADDQGGPIWQAAPACSPDQTCEPRVRAFWAASPTSVWAVGMGGQSFVLDDAEAGHWSPRSAETRVDLEGIWGSSANDANAIWAVGQAGTIRHISSGESAWTMTESPTSADLHAIWGSGPNDVWAVGDDGTVLHYDGRTWTLGAIGLGRGDVPTRLLGIWGSGPDDVWIVGDGVLLHRTAASRRIP